MKRIALSLFSLLLTLSLLLTSCDFLDFDKGGDTPIVDLSSIPEFSGKAFIEINGNEPYFTEEEKKTTKSFEQYDDLDALGRCTLTYACVGLDIMPTEDRGSISKVKPTGWQTVTYEIVDGKYLYNRCHLIGHQLTGENANAKNLITGTRYLNIEGMLPFENLVADYVKETENHVLYRVTPIYDGNDLVARGVLMEGYSVEDEGEGVTFCVYAYNSQPGVVINYRNGLSRLATADEWNGNESTDNPEDLLRLPTESDTFKINTKSKKIHTTSCSGVAHITDTCTGDMIAALKADGYTMCGTCDPFLVEVWEKIGSTDGGEGDGTGDNNDGTGEDNTEGGASTEEILFILNTSSKVIHTEAHGQTVSEQNRLEYRGTKDSVLEDNPGYHACGTCKPLD